MSVDVVVVTRMTIVSIMNAYAILFQTMQAKLCGTKMSTRTGGRCRRGGRYCYCSAINNKISHGNHVAVVNAMAT
jgi:MinD-like ATPase involved in chromosome partitioning or flagellar assembly